MDRLEPYRSVCARGGTTRARCATCRRFARLLPGETRCARCAGVLALDFGPVRGVRDERAERSWTLIVTGGGIAAVVWVLNKIGKALAAVAGGAGHGRGGVPGAVAGGQDRVPARPAGRWCTGAPRSA